MQYEFTKSVTVEGKPYQAGDREEQAKIPHGSLMSLVRVGWLVPVQPAQNGLKEIAPKK